MGNELMENCEIETGKRGKIGEGVRYGGREMEEVERSEGGG